MPTDYHTQLLDLARDSLGGRPNRARLNRAVSTAYYALFHLLVKDGTRLIQTDAGLRRLVGRAFDHGPMRDVCEQVRGGKLPKAVQALVSAPVPEELKAVAATFVALHGLRQEADYNPDRRPPFTVSVVQGHVDQVADAFEKWKAIAGQPVAKAFLLALLMHKKWDRGPAAVPPPGT